MGDIGKYLVVRCATLVLFLKRKLMYFLAVHHSYPYGTQNQTINCDFKIKNFLFFFLLI